MTMEQDAITEGAPQSEAAQKLAVEAWAQRKRMLPLFFDQAPGSAPAAPATMGAVAVDMRGVFGPRPNPEAWKFAAARALRQWPQGAEVTEAEFDEAVRIATVEHTYR